MTRVRLNAGEFTVSHGQATIAAHDLPRDDAYRVTRHDA
jgi:hypothetical protein